MVLSSATLLRLFLPVLLRPGFGTPHPHARLPVIHDPDPVDIPDLEHHIRTRACPSPPRRSMPGESRPRRRRSPSRSTMWRQACPPPRSGGSCRAGAKARPPADGRFCVHLGGPAGPWTSPFGNPNATGACLLLSGPFARVPAMLSTGSYREMHCDNPRCFSARQIGRAIAGLLRAYGMEAVYMGFSENHAFNPGVIALMDRRLGKQRRPVAGGPKARAAGCSAQISAPEGDIAHWESKSRSCRSAEGRPARASAQAGGQAGHACPACPLSPPSYRAMRFPLRARRGETRLWLPLRRPELFSGNNAEQTVDPEYDAGADVGRGERSPPEPTQATDADVQPPRHLLLRQTGFPAQPRSGLPKGAVFFHDTFRCTPFFLQAVSIFPASHTFAHNPTGWRFLSINNALSPLIAFTNHHCKAKQTPAQCASRKILRRCARGSTKPDMAAPC